jgi:hypothetical protein
MIKWNESRKLSRSRLLPQMLIDLSRSLPPQRKLACVARIASELLLADDVAVAQRMRQCSRCGQVSGLDGLADVVVGWGEMRSRLRLQRQGGKDDAKAIWRCQS